MCRLSVPLSCLLVFGVVLTGHADLSTDERQVLLIGSDQDHLQAALLAHDGQVTHRLPIIKGLGGTVAAQHIERLMRATGVNRVIEDDTVTEPPKNRECPVSGDLDTRIVSGLLEWRIHNFSGQHQPLNAITVSWPSELNQVSVQIQSSGELWEASDLTNGAARNTPMDLPAGTSFVRIESANIHSDMHQNDFEISITLAGCTASLPRAYIDNHNYFYFPELVAANLLHQAGVTGTGVGVAIIDSGLWDTPPLSLNTSGERRIVAYYDAIEDVNSGPITDPGGHGSHMASIIANSDHDPEAKPAVFKGIAPDVNLIPVRAFAPSGDADFLDIIRGLQWILDHHKKYNIRVVNMSLSATPNFAYWDDPINQAVLRLWQAGIVVVAAAGNDGPDWGTIGSPGNNPYVVTVGALTDSWTPADRSDDYIPDFSSRGPTAEGHIKPDLVAPGGHITGLIPSDSRLYNDNPNYVLKTGEFVSTGSSQAAAVVSGIAALLFNAKPDLSNDEIKCLLTTSATPAINRDGRLSYSPFVQGKGLVNAARALTIGKTTCDQDVMNIGAAIAGEEQLLGPTIQGESDEPLLPAVQDLVATTPSAKGAGDDRRWGVEAHLQRLNPEFEQSQADGLPVDWAAIYAQEQATIRSLTTQATEQ